MTARRSTGKPLTGESPLLPLTANAAKAIGSNHYFSGSWCKHGHQSKRYAKSGNCFRCNFEKNRRQLDALKAARRLAAELKTAQLYRQQGKAKRGANKSNGRKSQRSRDATPEAKTLTELKINKRQSSDWQAMADNPKAEARDG